MYSLKSSLMNPLIRGQYVLGDNIPHANSKTFFLGDNQSPHTITKTFFLGDNITLLFQDILQNNVPIPNCPAFRFISWDETGFVDSDLCLQFDL